jgi:hypothetical protein
VWLAFLALVWAVGTTLLWPSPLGYAFIALTAITFAACVAGRVALASYVARERPPLFEQFELTPEDTAHMEEERRQQQRQEQQQREEQRQREQQQQRGQDMSEERREQQRRQAGQGGRPAGADD